MTDPGGWDEVAPLLDQTKALSVDIGPLGGGPAGYIYRWTTLEAGAWRFSGGFIVYDKPGHADFYMNAHPPERQYIRLVDVMRMSQVDESDGAWARSPAGVRESLERDRNRRLNPATEPAVPPTPPNKRRRWWS